MLELWQLSKGEVGLRSAQSLQGVPTACVLGWLQGTELLCHAATPRPEDTLQEAALGMCKLQEHDYNLKTDGLLGAGHPKRSRHLLL